LSAPLLLLEQRRQASISSRNQIGRACVHAWDMRAGARAGACACVRTRACGPACVRACLGRACLWAGVRAHNQMGRACVHAWDMRAGARAGACACVRTRACGPACVRACLWAGVRACGRVCGRTSNGPGMPHAFMEGEVHAWQASTQAYRQACMQPGGRAGRQSRPPRSQQKAKQTSAPPILSRPCQRSAN